jgi:hypothetical protein
MEQGEDHYKIILAAAIAAIGGILLGRYIWGVHGAKRTLSSHVATLSRVLEQIENIDTEEAGNLKGRIENILKTLETSHGKTEEKPQ